jgi:NAD(P)-dependent dehydrogenase (short-subunit alcohol dehydrogenase family)
MDLQLQNKIVLVSGGAKGIGAAIVRGFAAEGAIPLIFDRNPGEAEGLIEEIGCGHFFNVELVELEQIRKAIEQVHEQVGEVDILVNNAGVNDGAGLEKDPQDFVASLKKNLIHPFALAHYLLGDLRNNRGNIINIGSKVADTGQGGTSGYAASKGAMNSLTREWAIDLARFGIRVNCVVPAEVMTPLYKKWLGKNPDPAKAEARIKSTIPLGNRFTRASEIADLVVFLASGRSSHTTGQVMYPDGGYTHLDRAYTTPPQ